MAQNISILQIKYAEDIGTCKYRYRYGEGKRGECDKHLELYYEYYLQSPSNGQLMQLGSKHINDELIHIIGLSCIDIRPEFRKQPKLPLELMCQVFPCSEINQRIEQKVRNKPKSSYIDYIKVLNLSFEEAKIKEKEMLKKMSETKINEKKLKEKRKRECKTIAYLNASSYLNKKDIATIIISPSEIINSSFAVEVHEKIFSLEDLINEGISKKKIVNGSLTKRKRKDETTKFFRLFEKIYIMEFYHLLDMDKDTKKYFLDPRFSMREIEETLHCQNP